MKFSLAFMKNKKNMAILMLLLSIFISLALSQLQYIQSLKHAREGFIQAADMKTYEMILAVVGDKDGTNAQKLSAVRSMVDMMSKLDKKDYLEILDNSKLTDEEKIIEIKKFKPIGLEKSETKKE